MKTRRTNRIKRRINYYDALEYDKQTKKTAKVSVLLFVVLYNFIINYLIRNFQSFE